ncbi:hypothetical protein CRE_14722 [Caenorhabditis remanei]|uniref:Uncharacterized protein n=1 Tax=Caenorhabditis remanei TaxID=31234 RepID=E3M9R7_CAERE|nr:hypothetical protein CRE_14722 [Caenorhabditis remanei]
MGDVDKAFKGGQAEVNSKPFSFIEAQYDGGDAKMKHLLESLCNNWFRTDEYKNGDDTNMKKFCCDKLDMCKFYKQTWFYLACGGGGFLILVIIIIIVACCCCRKGGRGKGGQDEELSGSEE